MRKVKDELQEAKDDVTHLTEKLTDIRSQKVKFSRLAREKGEELGMTYDQLMIWYSGKVLWGEERHFNQNLCEKFFCLYASVNFASF